MTGRVPTSPGAIAGLCAALGLAASCALQLATSGQVGLAIVAAGIAFVAVTSIIAIAGALPAEGSRPPAAICMLIAVYAFVTAFALPVSNSPTHGHGAHEGGHGHASSTT